MKTFIFCLLIGFSFNCYSQNKEFNILDFGAIPGSDILCTKAIQEAITKASDVNGKVIIPKGVFISGSVYLKSNIELNLEEGAVLKGSDKRSDYEERDFTSLLIGRDIENIKITGKGCIDGSGKELVKDTRRMIENGQIPDPAYTKSGRPAESKRPEIIQLTNCRHIRITGIMLKDAACWVESYTNCNDLSIDCLRVESTTFWNNDGIDVTDCKNVRITNSSINSADDGICLKSENRNSCCDSITIENCKIRSSASAFKCGTASAGGFKNITVKNLFIYNTYRSAIALELADGGIMENIDISNVEAKNTGNALFMVIGTRNRDNEQHKAPGVFQNIRISNLKVEISSGKPDKGYETEGPQVKGPHNLFPSTIIVGKPGFDIQNILLENIEITFAGGGKTEIANSSFNNLGSIPERPKDYPEYSMFGEIPAWGFYIRHANNMQFKNIKLILKNSDYRPAFVFDDTNNIGIKNVDLNSFQKVPAVVFNNSGHVDIKSFNVSGTYSEKVKQLESCSDINIR
jgi:polygalacturonase